MILCEKVDPLLLNMIMPVSPPVSRTCELGSCALVNTRIRSDLDEFGRLACSSSVFCFLFFIFSSKEDAM